MFKKISLILVFFSLYSCGYEPLYLKSESLNFSISKLSLQGDKKINRRIVSVLNLKENKEEKSIYEYVLISKKTVKIVSRDKKGNPSTYRMNISVKLSILNNNELIKGKIFNADFHYNNNINKFDLSQYEKDIEINLINEITDKIIFFLKS